LFCTVVGREEFLLSASLLETPMVHPKLPLIRSQTKKKTRERDDESDSDTGLIAYSNTPSRRHMQPDPEIEANEICSLGAGDPIVGVVTEPKQSHCAAVIHRKWADFSHSRVRPGEAPTTSLLQLWRL